MGRDLSLPGTYTFADLIEAEVLFVSDGYRAKNEELGGEGLIFLRAGHVTDSFIDFDGVERFHSELTPRVLHKVSAAGDVIVTTKGNSTGRTSYVTKDMPPFVYSPHLSFWRSLKAEVIDPGYLRYWSRSSMFQGQLAALAGSTDMAPYLSLLDQKRLIINLPKVVEQQAIGNVLTVIDNKIDLNRRMNQTLEAMGRALFKSWFVDFDPTGSMPSSWEFKKLRKVAAINPRSISGEREDRPIAYIDISSVSAGILENVKVFDLWNAPSRARLLVEDGDTIWSCVRPNRRSYLYIHSPSPDWVVSTGFAVLSPRLVPSAYLYAWVTTDDFVEYLSASADGSAYPAVRPAIFGEADILVPSSDVLSRYQDLAGPWLAKISSNQAESKTLAALRDTLLPKLLSGEIRVKQAEKIVEEVV